MSVTTKLNHPTPWTVNMDAEIVDATGACVCAIGDPLADNTPEDDRLALVIVERVNAYRELVRLLYIAYGETPVFTQEDPGVPKWPNGWRDRAYAMLKRAEAMDTLGTLGGSDL